jgi:hypothetical protein
MQRSREDGFVFEDRDRFLQAEAWLRDVFTLLPMLTGEGRAHHGEILRNATRLMEAGKVAPRIGAGFWGWIRPAPLRPSRPGSRIGACRMVAGLA